MDTFHIGARVKVIGYESYPNEKDLIGLIGTVRSRYGNSTIRVALDNRWNKRSALGIYYFVPEDLEIVDERNNIMEEKYMNNITNYLNIAKIQFVDERRGNVYEYANFEPDLKANDICVVMSAHHGLGVAKVVEIVDRNDLETQREVVAKVYTDKYDRRVENRAKASELKVKMQERAKKLQDIALYQMLAKDDPEMLSLLQEYQSLPNQ